MTMYEPQQVQNLMACANATECAEPSLGGHILSNSPPTLPLALEMRREHSASKSRPSCDLPCTEFHQPSHDPLAERRERELDAELHRRRRRQQLGVVAVHRRLGVGRRVEPRVHLDEVHRDEPLSQRHLFTDVVDLTVSQPAARAGARSGREVRIDRVNVERQVQRPVVVRVDRLERLLNHLCDTVLVDVSHREDMHVRIVQHLRLARVHVTEADVGEAVLAEAARLEPAKALELREPAEEVGGGHAVVVHRRRRLGRVGVGVRVDPDDAEPGVVRAHGADGARRDRVVAADREHEVALSRRLVHRIVHKLEARAYELGVDNLLLLLRRRRLLLEHGQVLARRRLAEDLHLAVVQALHPRREVVACALAQPTAVERNRVVVLRQTRLALAHADRVEVRRKV
mmetsp:Transcript_32941/g.69309  ORF Transcript_32941/g.69309 Transcript_32941/m.69309 type:complete len:401 (-) Transcript_32941:435-1637(-)